MNKYMELMYERAALDDEERDYQCPFCLSAIAERDSRELGEHFSICPYCPHYVFNKGPDLNNWPEGPTAITVTKCRSIGRKAWRRYRAFFEYN